MPAVLVSLLVLPAASAAAPLAAQVAPRLSDLPTGQGWIAGPSAAFDPQHPPTLFCKGRTPTLANLTASQVVLRAFLTAQLDGVTTTTVAFSGVATAHSWYSRQLRPGFASCVIRGAQNDEAAMGGAQGVPGSNRLIASTGGRLHVGVEAYELLARFHLSAGGTERDVWAVAHYGRVVFLVHSFSFSGKTPIYPAVLLANSIKRTPIR